jgi:carboxyl-terminal processing protease
VTKDREIFEGPEPVDIPREIPNLIKGRPVVILVNENSASASEILTGALKGHDGITVVGSRTYGKGVGQIWSAPLEDGTSMHYTMMRFYDRNGHTPGDGAKNRLGIAPDLEGRKQTYTAKMPDSMVAQALEILKAQTGVPMSKKR